MIRTLLFILFAGVIIIGIVIIAIANKNQITDKTKIVINEEGKFNYIDKNGKIEDFGVEGHK